MYKHLNYGKKTFILESTLDSAIFHRGEYANVRASTSIMRRLVEDVTGKKIEHLIKKALSEDREDLPLCRNVQLVGEVRRTACRIPAAFQTAIFPKIRGQLR